MDKERELSLFQITARYVAEMQTGRQPRLSDYLASYPCYVDAIADFVAYYHAIEETVSSMDTLPLTDVMVPSMTTILTTATGQRLMLSQIAAELDLSIDIILLLEQRAIAPVTIPRVLYEQIALLLQQSTAMVQQYIYSWDQREPGSAVQKSKQQMKVAEASSGYSVSDVVDKLKFRVVVETSLLLSVEQRNRWRCILDAEGI